ncbi:MAG: DNA polymerase III subunit gamma/tau [Runella slithyformis]|nr:MAG: DNA polymerase III subunit gamma/tau [Runella slithyformis]TAE95131.1 MAG: DNA polymerase III subunit gamma/tau [Runella slithyformis]TAF80620.1 MAG: DNA polymerase III subunit gamma/tau [Runella slithyformis]
MAENFVVSARKYRPVTFETVVGQSHITTTLRNAIRTKHLAQAFLFCGPRGVGKTTTARILAKTINCQNLADDVEACGVCDSCVAFQNNASFNVHELDAASNNSVDDIRQLIDQVRYPPQTGKYKIYIIDEVHMLSTAAFNAFLKTLEEPPSYAIFILATTEKHKILPTILSRCQNFDFNRIQVRDMADHLASIAKKEGIEVEREALELIAQKADGGLRDALSMFDLNVTFSTDNVLRYHEVVDNLHILDYDYYFKITDRLLDGDLSQSFLLFNEILQKGFDGHLFVVGLLEHLRNLLVSKDPVTVQLLEVSELAKSKYLEQSAKTPLPFLVSALSIGSQCDINYKAAKNQRLHVEMLLMKLSYLPNVLTINAPVGAAPQPAPADIQPTVSGGQMGAGLLPKASFTAEPPAVYEKTAPPTTSKLRSTVSIGALPVPVAPVAAAAVDETKALETPTETSAADAEFTPEELSAVWNDFVKYREFNDGSVSEQIMLNRSFTLNGTTIQLVLDNLIQENMLNEIRYDLLGYLRNRLKNKKIQIVSKVMASDVKRNPYTPQERFNALVERNPNLLKLQQALGLEVDF